jgi:secretion/DNA translocation related TadE-like protein
MMIARGERGSVSVLVAAILFLAGALCLVSVDLARALEAKAQAQTAADAASLAAARELALATDQGPQAAADYAIRNGATLVSCQCAQGTYEAIVDVEVPVDLLFVGSDRTVHAKARAIVDLG